ncbi:MAG: ABC transporter permease [Clostridiales bacterium]|nr:ABC transporter permease [Clostridiales bacterium]
MSRTPNIVSKYAKRTVFANKGRSILTLIGIIIATMMFCIVASAHQCAVDVLESFADDAYGKWHVQAYSMTSMDYQKVLKDDRINSPAYIQEIGYNPGFNSIGNSGGIHAPSFSTPYKYTYFVGAMSPNYAELCNLPVVLGRLPENSSEAIISLEMYSDGREEFTLGTTIHLDMYARYSEGHKVMNLQGLSRENDGSVNEELFAIGSKEYTIVGYFAVPEYAKWKEIADKTVLTMSDDLMGGAAVNAYFQLKDPSDYIQFTNDHFENEDDCLYNKDFIRMENSADDSRVHLIIGIVSAATISMIALLAIMLIYNSFSSSSSERLRAIGLLKSVGATRKQVRELMLTEAFLYSVIGIPIGILLGQGSSYLLLHALSGLGSDAGNYFIVKNIDLTFRIGYQNTIGAALLSLLTIFAAIFLPVLQVSRVLPIEAVRVKDNFGRGRERKRTHAITAKLLGFTGALSVKNYQRYRKRYLATVVSIMASCFMILFANMMVTSVTRNFHVDDEGSVNTICYARYTDDLGFTNEDEAMYYELQGVDTVTSGRLEYEVFDLIVDVPEESVSSGTNIKKTDGDKTLISMNLVFIDDASWRDICKRNNIDADLFLSYGSELCLVNGTFGYYEEGHEEERNIFTSLPEKMTLSTRYGSADSLSIPLQPAAEIDLKKDTQTDDSLPEIYVPLSRLEYYRLRDMPGLEIFQYTADKPVSTIRTMKEMLQNNLYLTDQLVDMGINTRAAKAVNSLVRIIMYGYVAMLSFVCFLNVIMTVISNIVFRRKEYILLTAVGMSRKTLFGMVIFESIVYFFESIVTLILILYLSIGALAVFAGRNVMGYINVPYFIIVILVHLLVVVGTTAIGLSTTMTDDVVEGIRKEYY